MNGTTSTQTVPATTTVARISPREIDLSCRPPLMLYFGSGLVWLFIGTLLALLASIKLHGPGFLAGIPCLTYGRLEPAATNAIVYGFAMQCAFGVLLWIMCRLGNVLLLFQATLCVAGMIWNLALTAGFLGILGGASTGYELLELPKFAAAMMFVAYLMIGVCAVVNFHFRRQRLLYPSQWYLLAALFWFAWIYSAAYLLLLVLPVRGVFQNVVNAWYVTNLTDLWFTSVALAIIFYFLPKLIDRPLYSGLLAAFGFWTLAFIVQWTGMARLISGPVPAWMVSVGIAANGLMVVPLIAVAMNLYLTVAGRVGVLRQTATGRFIWFAVVSYIVAAAVQILLGFRETSEVLHFTYTEVAYAQFLLHGFVAMALFGAIYYIVPRVTEIEWPALKAVCRHFTCYGVGVALIFVSLGAGGVLQGFRINQSTLEFVAAIRKTVPFVGVSTLGILLLLVGEFFLLKNFFTICHRSSARARAYAIDFLTGREALRRGA
jgi:cytochrome c oxidase cbb3-type subunit I